MTLNSNSLSGLVEETFDIPFCILVEQLASCGVILSIWLYKVSFESSLLGNVRSF
jgi:hypothetical protein